MIRARRFLGVGMVGGLLALAGCYGHSSVRPDGQERSAIEYSKRMIKEMSTGMDRLLSPALASTKELNGFRLFSGHAYARTDKTVADNYTKFCGSLGATFQDGACRLDQSDDSVRFFVKWTSEDVPEQVGSAYQQRKIVLEVYEPIGKPSPAFLETISAQGYLTEPAREAQAKESAEQAAAAEIRREQYKEATRQSRLAEQARTRDMMAETTAFRSRLKAEDETNCGPAIEIKGSLIKVYRPVAEFGTEHWLQKARLFPPGYGCSFMNGEYQPPYEF
jgi:hypothetical protein